MDSGFSENASDVPVTPIRQKLSTQVTDAHDFAPVLDLEQEVIAGETHTERASEQDQTCSDSGGLLPEHYQSTHVDDPKSVAYVTQYDSRGKLYALSPTDDEPQIKTLERAEVKDRHIEIRTVVNLVVGSDGKVQYDTPTDGKKEYKVQSIEKVVMTIYAPELVNAIRQLVLYYPSEAISNAASAGFVSVRRPYHMLQLHRDDLARLRRSYSPSSPGDVEATPKDFHSSLTNVKIESQQTTFVVSNIHPDENLVDPEDFSIYAGMQPLPHLTCNKKLYRQLVSLEAILDKEHKKEVEKERLCHEAGTANFDMLWYLLRPGSFVYAKIEDKWTGAVVYIQSKRHDPTSVYSRNGVYVINCWYLGFDGKKVRRIPTQFSIPAYNGAREITSLPVYPTRFGKDPNLLNRLVRRGKTYYEVLVAKYLQKHYRGEIVGDKRALYNGRVILDPGTASLGSSHPSKPYHLYEKKDFMGIDDDNRGDGIVGKRYLWEGFDNIDPQETPTLTNRHYFLFPQAIRGFALQKRTWETFDIDCVTPSPQNPGELDKLILDEEQKSIIKSLTQSAQLGKIAKAHGLALKDGRREGRIFLLHGPSGVGKTFTAECVAISTGRPLLSLTCAELGTDETKIEANLRKYFMLARAWDAIIVIDEADVYVEGRGLDVKRGNLVAAFLRALETFRNEYHGGIIFLTTNRIFKVDLAVRSRIHIPIYYSPLDDKDRVKIYKQCVEALNTQGFDVPQSSSFTKTMKEMEWNGREIGNSLQTIAALAEFDHSVDESLQPNQSIQITEAHINPVLNQFRDFKAYFDDNQFSESEVATNKGERADKWGSEEKQRRKRKFLEEQKERADAESRRLAAEILKLDE